MQVNKRLWIDPSKGWMYGFPKLWIPEEHGNLNTWLVANGYPPEKLNRYTTIRYWPDDEGEDAQR